ncbi:MAG: ABC transporter ATP-binding protein [Bacteroidota bacterium]
MRPRLELTSVGKAFQRRSVFRGITAAVEGGEALLITGRNGAGKSTLIRIIADLLRPGEGTVRLLEGGEEVESSRARRMGLVAPYLQLYDEFGARENLQLGMRLRGLRYDPGAGSRMLERVGLGGREDDPVRVFSSGMKQRLKYAQALIHAPGCLLLDEPMSNLDATGCDMVRRLMEEQRGGGILVVATNDARELPHHEHRVDLDA